MIQRGRPSRRILRRIDENGQVQLTRNGEQLRKPKLSQPTLADPRETYLTKQTKMLSDLPKDQLPSKGNLTNKNRQFVWELIKTGSTSDAFLQAYGKSKNPSSSGRAILKKPAVMEFYLQEVRKQKEKAGIDTEQVLKELSNLAASNVTDFLSWSEEGIRVKSSDELRPEHTAAIQEISEVFGRIPGQRGIKIKLHSKVQSLKLLGQHLGMFEQNPFNGDMHSQAMEFVNVIQNIYNSVPTTEPEPEAEDAEYREVEQIEMKETEKMPNQ